MVARRSGHILDLPKSKAALSKRVKQMIEGVKLVPASHSVGKAFRNYEPAIDLFPVHPLGLESGALWLPGA